ncbi:MAG: hypothetical protein MZV70_06360 [Desulfobacterales bacterium]|nr:hypothetical protein [Desulfobacterales bacterium]
MSNAAGQSVSSFYYRYTLYPAEVFKPLDQRLGPHGGLARCRIRRPPDVQAGADPQRLPAGRCGRRCGPRPAHGRRAHAVHPRKGRSVLDTTAARFLADPLRALAEISTRTDRWPFFRAFTFYGVLLAFPMALYCLLFAGLRLLAGIVAGDRRADILCAAACLAIGLGILAFFHSSRQPPPRPEELSRALGSAAWQTRVAALREIRDRRLDVGAHPAYAAMLRSPHPQERYWLARALAISAKPGGTRRIDPAAGRPPHQRPDPGGGGDRPAQGPRRRP